LSKALTSVDVPLILYLLCHELGTERSIRKSTKSTSWTSANISLNGTNHGVSELLTPVVFSELILEPSRASPTDDPKARRAYLGNRRAYGIKQAR